MFPAAAAGRVSGSIGSARRARPASASSSASENGPWLAWRETFMPHQPALLRWTIETRSTIPGASKKRRRKPAEPMSEGRIRWTARSPTAGAAR